MSPVTIHRNDDTLAHGCARSIHAEQSENALRHVGKVKVSTSVKAFVGNLRKYFDDQVLDIKVDRATGSRARASAILLVADARKDFAVVVTKFDARFDPPVCVRTPPLTIARHTIARGLQRTIGAADMAELARRASDHLMIAAGSALVWSTQGYMPCEVVIAGQGVALLCDWDGRRMTINTWLDGSTAADPEIRRLASSDEVTITVK